MGSFDISLKFHSKKESHRIFIHLSPRIPVSSIDSTDHSSERAGIETSTLPDLWAQRLTVVLATAWSNTE